MIYLVWHFRAFHVRGFNYDEWCHKMSKFALSFGQNEYEPRYVTHSYVVRYDTISFSKIPFDYIWISMSRAYSKSDRLF